MSDLHPHWQPTDDPPASDRTHGASGQDEEQPLPVRVTERSAATSPVGVPRSATVVSRQPAALAGILLAVTVGLAIFLGSDGDAGGTHTVHITSQGFTPQHVSVAGGERITWVNDSTTTHVLQSNDLCSGDRHCLVTQTIAPGAETSLTISDAFAPGTSTYYSIALQGLTGTVTVLPSAGTASGKPVADAADKINVTATSLPLQGERPSEGDNTEEKRLKFRDDNQNLRAALPYEDAALSSSSFPPAASSSRSAQASAWDGGAPPTALSANDGGAPESATPFDTVADAAEDLPSSASALIPVNPYTVGNRALDASGKPLAGNGASSKGKTTLHGGAPARPLSQPSTGPETWIVVLGSLGALGFLKRKELKKQK